MRYYVNTIYKSPPPEHTVCMADDTKVNPVAVNLLKHLIDDSIDICKEIERKGDYDGQQVTILMMLVLDRMVGRWEDPLSKLDEIYDFCKARINDQK